MASHYQRFLIVTILLIAFTGRIGIYAMPVHQKFIKDILSEHSGKKTEKTEQSDKEEPLEEKVKLADLIAPELININFLYTPELKNNFFSESFILTHCHLPIPEQPPKNQLS
ncbi:hypothetical protein [Pedobacter rhodius]|uniref:Uncharacterized protein n=1 Tax=Pedobacter rhodius TaxID=3004098 RepID=A0ABT4L365_9SPHI|nr:hypothetical protein [Pedobacter sp. SJ11]MCZ4224503.1 hypothetical protein [Pedobacter sp. SJ11]